MTEQNFQQEAKDIEVRDDSAQSKGRVPLTEEQTPLGQRVLGVAKDSFTSTAESQSLDQAGKPGDLMAEDPE